MVKIVHTPSIARQLFTDRELSGHPDGIRYTPKELKARRKYRAQNNLKLPVEDIQAEAINFGEKL